MFKSLRFIALAVLAALVLSGCFSRPASEGQIPAKPVVAVSIVPQESWVKAIAGDLVDVVTLIPPGKSAETYSPNPQQMTQFSKASVYFTMNVPAETAGILQKAKDLNRQVRIVDLAAIVRQSYPDLTIEAGEEAEDEHDHDHESDHGHVHKPGERDPHIWLSPKRAILMVQATAAELAVLDPAHKAVFEKNAAEYINKLRQLDQSIQSQLAGSKNKKFIIYHPSIGYFASDYGLKMIALEQHGKEATAQNLQKVIDLAKKEKIKAILYQEEMDSRQAKTFASEIGGVTLKITPLAADYIGGLEAMTKTLAEGTR